MYAIRHGSLIIELELDFISLIESFNLQQRVQQATHSAGHT